MYGMSRAEFTVYSYVVQGLSNKEVADKVFTSEKTVKSHLTNIYKKLNVKSRTKMMAKNLNKPSINTPTTTTQTPKGALPMSSQNSQLATHEATKKSLDVIDEKFRVGEVMNHLHSMMKGVTEKEVTPETVIAACQCVSKMNEVMNTTIDAAKFLRSNG